MEKERSTLIRRPDGKRTPSVVLHYWGRRGGGSEFTYYLAQHLNQSAEAPEVTLSLARQNADISRFKETGLRIVTFDRPSVSTLPWQAWSLPRMLRIHADALASLQPNAVIMTMNAPFAWPFIGMLQRRGIKVYYVAHDAEPHPGDYAVIWQRLTQDLLMKRADRIVALSRCVAERITQRIPASAERLSVIPLETAYPARHARGSRERSFREPVRLLFYGRLLPYKGLDFLVEALKPLRTRPEWRLTIAGSGPLEASIRLALATWPQVDLELGWISEQRTAELFASHHLLLCPYVEASQSGVIAQALSWGMPSLVMPTGALPEQIAYGTAGLVAETADAEGFRRGLQTLLDQPSALAELSQGATMLLAERRANRGWMELVGSALRR